MGLAVAAALVALSVPQKSRHQDQAHHKALAPVALPRSTNGTCADVPDFFDHWSTADETVPVPYFCSSWEGISCDMRTAARCNFTAEEVENVKENCPETCGLCPVKVGDDPIFHYGGKWYKVNMPKHQAVPLLRWRERGTQYRLFGTTFGSKDDPSAQWFDRFTLHANGATVLSVERATTKEGAKPSPGLHTISVALDGKPLPRDKTSSLVRGTHGVKLSVHTNGKAIGTELGERVKVDAGGHSFEIFSKAAEKYNWAESKVKYAHINLKVPQLPPNAQGFLAELTGKRPLSAESMAYIAPVKTQIRHGTAAMWASWDEKTHTLSHSAVSSGAISTLAAIPPSAVSAEECPVERPQWRPDIPPSVPPPASPPMPYVPPTLPPLAPPPPASPPYVPLCDPTTEDFRFEGMEVIYNNLGGMGPNTAHPREIRIGMLLSNFEDPANPGEAAHFQLVITNLTEYNTDRASRNGLSGAFAQVNIGPRGFTRLRFNLVADLDNNPLTIPIHSPFFSFFDFDYTTKSQLIKDRTCGEVAVFEDSQFNEFFGETSDDVHIHTSSDGTKTCSAKVWGDAWDNVKDPEKLTPTQLKRSVGVEARSTTFEFSVGLSNLKKAQEGIIDMTGCRELRRNFQIGGFSAARTICHSPSPPPPPEAPALS